MGPPHRTANRSDHILVVGTAIPPVAARDALHDETRARVRVEHERLLDRDGGLRPFAIVQPRAAGLVGARKCHEAPAALDLSAAIVVEQVLLAIIARTAC